jgi:cbb3-type cytochrome oxidase subunit 3
VLWLASKVGKGRNKKSRGRSKKSRGRFNNRDKKSASNCGTVFESSLVLCFLVVVWLTFWPNPAGSPDYAKVLILAVFSDKSHGWVRAVLKRGCALKTSLIEAICSGTWVSRISLPFSFLTSDTLQNLRQINGVNMPSSRLFRILKQPTIRESATSTLTASAATPKLDSGFTFVDNSQGASAAIAELTRSLDFVLDQIDLERTLLSPASSPGSEADC